MKLKTLLFSLACFFPALSLTEKSYLLGKDYHLQK